MAMGEPNEVADQLGEMNIAPTPAPAGFWKTWERTLPCGEDDLLPKFKEADEEVKQMASRIPLMTAILTNLTQIWGWDKTCEKLIKQFAENLLASVEAIERHQRSSFGWGATETNKTLKSLASHQDRLINTINCWILVDALKV
eukprot:g33375.t1